MAESHPYGIQPVGNLYLQGGANCRADGLGSLAALPDDLLLDLLGRMSAVSLVRLSMTSKALYCFCNHEDLWKALVLEELSESFRWRGTWRESYLVAAAPGYTPGSHQPLSVRGFYSDLLYQPWFCATIGLAPHWLEADNIDRRSKLTLQQFRKQYEQPNRPVVLTDGLAGWAARKKWSPAYLAAAFAGQQVLVGNYPMPMDAYLEYAATTCDEMPLYLFDQHFTKRAPALAADYAVPRYFAEDLFSVLGEAGRPDYRWLIMGPPRAGSSFHIDPNATSAWNAVVTGKKKWILYPPGVTPPGVHPSPDGADVATPLSLIEWFVNHYDQTKEGKVEPVECIVSAGELIFVPRGWWHMAMNLEESIAVTQNYVSSINLPHVLSFLRSRRADLVSGCAMEDRTALYDRFIEKLREQKPELLEQLEADKTAKKRKARQSSALASLFKDGLSDKSDKTQCCEGISRHSTASLDTPHQQVAVQAAGFSFGFKL